MNKYLLTSFTLGLLTALEAIALYGIQKYQRVNQKKFMVISMLIYGICVPLLLYKMITIDGGIGMANFLWNVFSTLAGFLIGMLLFKEKINNIQCIGIALGFLSLGLIFVGESKNKNKA
jgi:multidrug transporter EmrE-like cation transporter